MNSRPYIVLLSLLGMNSKEKDVIFTHCIGKQGNLGIKHKRYGLFCFLYSRPFFFYSLISTVLLLRIMSSFILGRLFGLVF